MSKKKVIHFAKYDYNTSENVCGIDSHSNVISYTAHAVTCKRCLAKMGTCEHCHRGEVQGENTCPYKEEINGDSESLCTCCEDCRYNCAMDI